MKKKKWIILIVAAVLITVSCSKKENRVKGKPLNLNTVKVTVMDSEADKKEEAEKEKRIKGIDVNTSDAEYRIIYPDPESDQRVLVELKKIDSVDMFYDIVETGMFMDLTFTESPDKKFIFFACGSIENEAAEIFGHTVSVVEGQLQFIYDIENDQIINGNFTHCNSMFVRSQWFVSDSLLVLDIGTSAGRGLVIYNFAEDKELYQGKGLAGSFQDSESKIVLFSEERNYLAFNSFSAPIFNAPGEAYRSIAVFINLKTFEVKEFIPESEEVMTGILRFEGSDKLIYHKYTFDEMGEIVYVNDEDKQIEVILKE